MARIILVLSVALASSIFAARGVAQDSQLRVAFPDLRLTEPALTSGYAASRAPANETGRSSASEPIADPSNRRTIDRDLLRLQMTAPLAAVSGAALGLWAWIGRPRTIEDGSCGGVITPLIAGPVFVISAVLVGKALIDRRRHLNQGQIAVPRSRGQRIARWMGIGVLTVVVSGALSGPLFIDSLCYT